jgi:hypothetical protein
MHPTSLKIMITNAALIAITSLLCNQSNYGQTVKLASLNTKDMIPYSLVRAVAHPKVW